MFGECGFCETPFDEHVEVFRGDGDRWLEWAPCCEAAEAEVAAFGFEAFAGFPLETMLSELLSCDVREVTDDGTVRGRIETEAPGELWERRGRPAVRSPAGWRDFVFSAVEAHHRHMPDAPTSHKFSVAAYNGGVLVGVAVVGRPVSRLLEAAEPRTLEVTRVCAWGHPALRRNIASALYGACVRKARALGIADALITYTLETELGASLRAAGFVEEALSRGGTRDRPSRRRLDRAPICRKRRWRRAV
jgi:hypothetical protein